MKWIIHARKPHKTCQFFFSVNFHLRLKPTIDCIYLLQLHLSPLNFTFAHRVRQYNWMSCVGGQWCKLLTVLTQQSSGTSRCFSWKKKLCIELHTTFGPSYSKSDSLHFFLLLSYFTPDFRFRWELLWHEKYNKIFTWIRRLLSFVLGRL